MKPLGIGIIGAGDVSSSYLPNLIKFPDIRVSMIGDLDAARAEKLAGEFGIARWGSMDDVLANKEVELVVNLTPPAAHYHVSSSALSAGKHVWSEKPITVDRESADALVDQAAKAGLRLGVAPDTLLGPGMQSSRRLIARGEIGRPLSAMTIFQSPGPVNRPDPEYLFRRGAGPLFDMGPYYYSALVQVFGPITRVAAVGTKASPTRMIMAGPRKGTPFEVMVPTNVAVLAEFAGGGMAQSTFSFDARHMRQGFFEIYGTEATLSIPDPNRFTGPLKIAFLPSDLSWRPIWEIDWQDRPVGGEAGRGGIRGLGVVDMVRSIASGKSHVASAELGRHVLDVLVSVEESAETGEFVAIKSTVSEVPLLDEGWDPYTPAAN